MIQKIIVLAVLSVIAYQLINQTTADVVEVLIILTGLLYFLIFTISAKILNTKEKLTKRIEELEEEQLNLKVTVSDSQCPSENHNKDT